MTRERDPPSGKSLERIEASSNGRLWAITTDGLVYSYVKPF